MMIEGSLGQLVAVDSQASFYFWLDAGIFFLFSHSTTFQTGEVPNQAETWEIGVNNNLKLQGGDSPLPCLLSTEVNVHLVAI